MGNREMGNKCKLIVIFTLTFTFFLVEIVTGHLTNSMSLIADSFHMLSDVAALAVAFLSLNMSAKKWSKNTFGWARAEVLGALVNAAFLVALCFTILIESIDRFTTVEDIENPEWMLIVGILGLVINVIGLFMFRDSHGHSHGSSHGHSHHQPKKVLQNDITPTTTVSTPQVTNTNGAAKGNGNSHPKIEISPSSSLSYESQSDRENGNLVHVQKIKKPNPSERVGVKSSSASQMNMRGIFLHMLADALGSIIVIISALIIWLTTWEYKMYIDPVLSILLVIIILCSVQPLLKESAMILLQTVPTHIQIDELEHKLIEQVEGVIAIHQFHIWQLAGDKIIASAHIRCRNPTEYMRIAEKVKDFFHNEGIHSTTIQPEFTEHFPDLDLLALGDSDCLVVSRTVSSSRLNISLP